MKGNKEENEEEWIEVVVECPDCIKGRVVQWVARKSDKPPWRYHMPCDTCKGSYQSTVWQPRYCQIPDCKKCAKHKCAGVFCSANGWVCTEHWVEENIGYSEKGFVCINCWNEVGSGGH